MATRFYFAATTTPTGGVTPGFAAWTRTSEGIRRWMGTTKDGSTLTGTTFWANTSPTANQTCLAVQFVSDPLAGGVSFTTSDTVKLVAQARESAANDNINRSPICIKVYAADGTTLQATLLALGHVGPNTTEWLSSGLRNKQFADGDALTANYTTVEGDRLVVEIGGQVSASAGTTVTGTINIGSSSGTDLSENETETTANDPWFEISTTVLFYTPSAAPQPAQLVSALAPIAMAAPWYWHQDLLPVAAAAAREETYALTQMAVQTAMRAASALAVTANLALTTGAGWQPDTLPPQPVPLAEEAYRPEAPAPWKLHGLPVWIYQADDRLPLGEDPGYQPPAPLPADVPMAWLSAPTGGFAEEVSPAGVVGDEGAFMVVPAVPDYVLLPPPSSGMSNDTTQVGSIEFEDTYDAVRLLFGVPKRLADPVLYVDASEAQAFTPSEDYWVQPRPMVWAVRTLPPFQTDEYPNGVAPSAREDDPYRPVIRVAWPVPALPFGLGEPDVLPIAPVVALSEDAYQPPMPRGLAFGLAWVSPETGGYAPEVPVVAPPDEDAFIPPPPINIRPVVLPVWDNQNEYYLAPFFLDEDLDPEQIQRALPPVWKAVRPLWHLWDVDEARVTPVFASGGLGVGRTHLFLGQIPNSASPASAAGALYVLTGGYGTAAGTDTPLVIETPDVAPLGQAGRIRLRRIAVPFQYAAACTVKVTPIVDYMTELEPVIVTHGEPGTLTRHMIQVKTMTACTVVRLRIEVLARAGAVEFYRPSLFFTPLTGGTTMAMGGAP